MPKIRYVAVPDPDARGARTGGETERNPPSLAQEKEKEGEGGFRAGRKKQGKKESREIRNDLHPLKSNRISIFFFIFFF